MFCTPRVDWRFWFLPLNPGKIGTEGWFLQFCEALRCGKQPVLRLLQHNPFPEAPPTHIRCVLYEFRFACDLQPGTGEEDARLAANACPASTSAASGKWELGRWWARRALREVYRINTAEAQPSDPVAA